MRRWGNRRGRRQGIVSPMFEGRSRVDRHRLVNEAVADLLKHRVHALAVKAYAPGEPIK